MLLLSRKHLFTSLIDLGLTTGDNVMVHSEIIYLGIPEGGLQTYLEVILDIIGSTGTITVPAFYNGFPKTRRYDPITTSSLSFGAFVEYVRTHPATLRSIHPFCSLASIGAYANELSDIDTPSVVGPGSTYERMLELNYKLLFLGGEKLAGSIVHCAELEYDVPYRKWMDFTGMVKVGDTWKKRTYKMHVRRRDIGANLDFDRIGSWLHEKGVVKTLKLNYGVISLCYMTDYLSVVAEKLQKDPWALVANIDEAKKRYENV